MAGSARVTVLLVLLLAGLRILFWTGAPGEARGLQRRWRALDRRERRRVRRLVASGRLATDPQTATLIVDYATLELTRSGLVTHRGHLWADPRFWVRTMLPYAVFGAAMLSLEHRRLPYDVIGLALVLAFLGLSEVSRYRRLLRARGSAPAM